MYTIVVIVVLVVKFGTAVCVLSTEHVPEFETLELCDSAGHAIKLAWEGKNVTEINYVCVKTKETKE